MSGSMMVEMSVEGACVTRVTRGVADDAWSRGLPVPRVGPCAGRRGPRLRALLSNVMVCQCACWNELFSSAGLLPFATYTATEHTSITITRL